MTFIVFALLIGVVAGLRAMMAPAVISWAAYLGWVALGDTPLAFLGFRWTPWIVTLLALVELVTDQLPSAPARTVPVQFGARLVSGALCGTALGAAAGQPIAGALAGVVGAVLGTLGGQAVRAGLAQRFGADRPAALIEDAAAIAGAWLIAAAVR